MKSLSLVTLVTAGIIVPEDESIFMNPPKRSSENNPLFADDSLMGIINSRAEKDRTPSLSDPYSFPYPFPYPIFYPGPFSPGFGPGGPPGFAMETQAPANTLGSPDLIRPNRIIPESESIFMYPKKLRDDLKKS